MGSNLLVFRPRTLDLDQVTLLPIETDGLHLAARSHRGGDRLLLSCDDGRALILLVGVLALGEGGIVEFSAPVQHARELLFSGLVWIQAVLVGLEHSLCLLSVVVHSPAVSRQLRR